MSIPKRTIKVLVSVNRGMLRDMLVGIVGSQLDMEVIEPADKHEKLAATLCHAAPDVAIVAPDAPVGLHDYDEVLHAAPHLKILAIFGSEQHGLLFEMRPSQSLLGEMSPHSLLGAIRVATAPSAAHVPIAAQGRG